MRVLLFTITLSILFAEHECNHGRFTPLDTDNHPCKAENLKLTNRYLCSSEGEVFCQTGWEEPSDPNLKDPLNPCPIPVCELNGQPCEHGDCKAPNYCTCEVGWEGPICDICIPLPGCQHGNCTDALECNCQDGWTGGFCEVPHCSDCENGVCEGPEECVCFSGWEGNACDRCQPLPGCANGDCVDHPNTCECNAGWTGHLCDQPECNNGLGCEHGTCVQHPSGGENFCVCETGWQGDSCDRCVPYWECPQPNTRSGIPACVNPNDCICTTPGLADPKGLCGHEELGGTRTLGR